MMEKIKKIFKAIGNFIGNVTMPVRKTKWYQALPKLVRLWMWNSVVGMVFYPHIFHVLTIIGIIAYGYVSAHGADKAKADAKAAADKAITKVKELSK